MNQKLQIITSDAPAPTGPYSQGIAIGNLLFVAGQRGQDPITGELCKGIEIETRRAILNIEAILKAHGCGLKDIVKTTVYLSDTDDFARMNEVYRSMIPVPYPVRTTVGARLRCDIAVEIDVIAFIPG